MTEFKVGDRVRVTSLEGTGIHWGDVQSPLGKEGGLSGSLRVGGELSYEVFMDDGLSWWFGDDHLELIEDAPKTEKPGVWVAVYPGETVPVVSTEEIDVLRHAVKHGMDVHFVEIGEAKA